MMGTQMTRLHLLVSALLAWTVGSAVSATVSEVGAKKDVKNIAIIGERNAAMPLLMLAICRT
jgi:hypothetical protein